MKSHLKTPIFVLSLLAGLGLLMTGCSSVPEGSSTVKQQALSFTPPTGMAGVYAIRPWKFMGAAVLFNARIDYQQISSLGTDSYLFGLVPPGVHVVSSPISFAAGRAPYKATYFTAAAGKNYFFRFTPGLNGATIVQLSEADGMAYVKKFKLSGNSHFADMAYYTNREYTIPLRNQQTNCPILSVRVSSVKEHGKEILFYPGSINLTGFGAALQDGLKITAQLRPVDSHLQMNLSFDFDPDEHIGKSAAIAGIVGGLTLGTVRVNLREYSYQSTVTAETIGRDGKSVSFSAKSQEVIEKYNGNDLSARLQAISTAQSNAYSESMNKLVTQLVQSGIFQGEP